MKSSRARRARGEPTPAPESNDPNEALTAGREDLSIEPAWDGASDPESLIDVSGSDRSSRYDHLALVLHEMRAPLSSLTVTVELLLGNVGEIETTDLQALLERAQRSTSWLQSLVENLTIDTQLEASRLTVHWQVVNLGECLDLAGSIVQPSLDRENQRLVVDGLHRVRVVGDRHQIERILVNLLLNASKYGGSQKTIRVKAIAVGDRVRIDVSDEGPGISETERQAIFCRYVQGSAARVQGAGGLGLGLHIVKTLVELHGGTVGVDSEVGKGATFWFTVPGVDDTGVEPGQPWEGIGP